MSASTARTALLALAMICLALGGTLYLLEQNRKDGGDGEPGAASGDSGDPATSGSGGARSGENSAGSAGSSSDPGAVGESPTDGGGSADASGDSGGADGATGEEQESSLDGGPNDPRDLTSKSMDLPTMRELDPSDPGYDPRAEAHQAFHPMEQTLLEAEPLDPQAFKDALSQHQLRNAGVAKRAGYLRKSGHPELAQELMAEWGHVYGTWQARAYGRGGPPGYRSATHQP